jgi:hypothetical protein
MNGRVAREHLSVIQGIGIIKIGNEVVIILARTVVTCRITRGRIPKQNIRYVIGWNIAEAYGATAAKSNSESN